MRFKTEFASVSKGALTFEADENGIIDIPDLHVHLFTDSIGGILQHAPAEAIATADDDDDDAAAAKAQEKADAAKAKAEAKAKAKADAAAAKASK